MLYLLDANVLITAHNAYYPMDQVPEFWASLQYQGERGRVKIPLEIREEILGGRDDDLLLAWMKEEQVVEALLLDENVDAELVRRVVSEGYANDLNDTEIEELGRDPFLISYALVKPERWIVTTEVSKPSKRRQNRHIPDVCASFPVPCCGPFHLNRSLGFRTAWRPS